MIKDLEKAIGYHFQNIQRHCFLIQEIRWNNILKFCKGL